VRKKKLSGSARSSRTARERISDIPRVITYICTPASALETLTEKERTPSTSSLLRFELLFPAAHSRSYILAPLVARVTLLASLRVPTTRPLLFTAHRRFLLPIISQPFSLSSYRTYSSQTTSQPIMSNTSNGQDKWKIAIVGTSPFSLLPPFSPRG
jgi:hypothetical protein